MEAKELKKRARKPSQFWAPIMLEMAREEEAEMEAMRPQAGLLTDRVAGQEH